MANKDVIRTKDLKLKRFSQKGNTILKSEAQIPTEPHFCNRSIPDASATKRQRPDRTLNQLIPRSDFTSPSFTRSPRFCSRDPESLPIHNRDPPSIPAILSGDEGPKHVRVRGAVCSESSGGERANGGFRDSFGSAAASLTGARNFRSRSGAATPSAQLPPLPAQPEPARLTRRFADCGVRGVGHVGK